MNVIKVENLTKKYGDFTAVNHVSFEVEKGTMLGFLGVNGAGKTTVINMLATLLKPDEGEASLCGEILGKKDRDIRRKIGIVYQQNCLDDILSVKENLICRGILHGASGQEAEKQCKRLGKILKLDELMKKKYKTLSGGQKRRCEIAAALMHRTPDFLGGNPGFFVLVSLIPCFFLTTLRGGGRRLSLRRRSDLCRPMSPHPKRARAETQGRIQRGSSWPSALPTR